MPSLPLSDEDRRNKVAVAHLAFARRQNAGVNVSGVFFCTFMKRKIKKLYLIGKSFSNEANDTHVAAYASSAAFFMVLSLIPMLLLVCSIVPFTPISRADLIKMVDMFVPKFLIPYAENTIDEVYDNSFTALSISGLVTLWSAGKSMLAICRGLDSIHHAKIRTNYVFLRIRASIYTVILLAVLLILLLLGVFEKGTVNFVEGYLPAVAGFTPFLSWLKDVLIFIATFLFFLAMFTFLPNRKLKANTQIVGALFTALSWSVFSYIFSIYVSRFAVYSVYGSMTTIAFTMFWFYCLFYLLFLGALIGRFLEPATQYLANESAVGRRKRERKKDRLIKDAVKATQKAGERIN